MEKETNLLLCKHRAVANSNHNPVPRQLRWSLYTTSFNLKWGFYGKNRGEIEKGRIERDGEEEAVAVVQSVEGATVNDSFIGVGRREGGNHHGIIVNRHNNVKWKVVVGVWWQVGTEQGLRGGGVGWVYIVVLKLVVGWSCRSCVLVYLTTLWLTTVGLTEVR